MCNVLRVRKNIVYSEASSSGISWREGQKVSRVQIIDIVCHAEEFRFRPAHNGKPRADFKKRNYMMRFQT